MRCSTPLLLCCLGLLPAAAAWADDEARDLAVLTRSPTPGAGSHGAPTVLAAGTVVTVAMRHRTSVRSTLYADASGVRGHGFEGGPAVVGKVGIEFETARSAFSIHYGGLGLRLAGDTHMTLRLKRGGFGIIARRAF